MLDVDIKNKKAVAYIWSRKNDSTRTLKLTIDLLKKKHDTLGVLIFRADQSAFKIQQKPYIMPEKNALVTNFGKEYTWFLNGKPIPNSNNQKHEPQNCGIYKAAITFYNGETDTTEEVYFQATDSDGNIINETSANTYPNPFKNALNIKYKTCNNAPVTINIFSSTGALIYSITNVDAKAGENIFQWNNVGVQLRYGLYFVQIYSGNELISTHKVIKR